MTTLIDSRFNTLRAKLSEIFARLSTLAQNIGSEDDAQVAQALIKNVNAPLRFVIVGEIKAGKSSLVNALVGKDICDVAPDPCTDKIHLIEFSPEHYEKKISEHVLEIGLNDEALRDIAIVDTPGTNSVLEFHQAITEKYIPESDLVIFVFPALNPYAKTAWDLFSFIEQSWRKKVIFVLQQSDRATSEELSTNIRRVQEYAKDRGHVDANIFVVSAHVSKTDPDKGGLSRLRDYIRQTVSGGKNAFHKVHSLVETGNTVLDKLKAGLETQAMEIDKDTERAARVEEKLKAGRKQVLREVEVLSYRQVKVYEGCADRIIEDFQEGLSVVGVLKGSVLKAVGKKDQYSELIKKLHQDFIAAFTARSEQEANKSAGHITEATTRIMDDILDEFRNQQGRIAAGPQVSGLDSKRLDAVRKANENVLSLLGEEKMDGKLRPKNLHKVGDKVFAGGAMSTAGAIIAGTAHAAVFDITGGVFAALGILLAVHSLFFNRKSIVAKFKEGFVEGRKNLELELTKQLSGQVDDFFDELDGAIAPFFANIKDRQDLLEKYGRELEAIGRELSQAATQVGEDTR